MTASAMLSYTFWKRCSDVMVSSIALILLLPILLLVAIAVRAALGSPIFFRQLRPGLNGKPFLLYKFRTMREANDYSGGSIPDSERLTSFGRLLRSTSVDELPELWNVLRGDMSLVGPRPLLLKYLPYYTDREQVRHTVRPGITGWAQVNGRNTLSWSRRLEHDIWYVANMSLRLDLQILRKTLASVFRRQGVVVIPGETMLDLDVERSSISARLGNV